MLDPQSLEDLNANEEFIRRHIGPDAQQVSAMLKALGVNSLDALISRTVPQGIRSETTAELPNAINEHAALKEIRAIAEKNQVFKSYLGMGYHDTHVPPIILRNVLENPAWYTAYTPYQPEIAQGRLEGLLNFQQMIVELTGMEMANASMLDEATAAAEAMAMAKRTLRKNKSDVFFVDENCHPQTIAVIQTRAEYFGFDVLVGNPNSISDQAELFGALIQYPGSTGHIPDLAPIIDTVHQHDALAIVAADIMSLVMLTPPGKLGADIVVGSNQRFGVPMGFGGPHAAFYAFKEKFKRATPGRIIGVSVDAKGKPALRMAMQTREQHIRREKANSNICTSQVLLALMSVFYAMYHGAEGVQKIAERIHFLTKLLAVGCDALGLRRLNDQFFDTLHLDCGDQCDAILAQAISKKINLRKVSSTSISISVNECCTTDDIDELLELLDTSGKGLSLDALFTQAKSTNAIPSSYARGEIALSHEIFKQYQSETEMMRYLKRLESRDIALTHSMIPLGSCTMKLNATSEMIPVTWPEFGKIHPFAPKEQTLGYQSLFSSLEDMLKACTGYDAISLQPNAGSQGEYAGLLTIKKYFEHRGEDQRTICLIPASAHGTNPASAQMAGLKVVVTACDSEGNVDIQDLKTKVEAHGANIAALMVTYPSTHGVFEEEIQEICDLMHSVGAQVYIDGANMNALVGLAAPGKFGGDVSHLNLHKTFCIPHGGGGPGMGPIGVKEHLADFLPVHPTWENNTINDKPYTISAAGWGSASILPISWMYIRMMGNKGMKAATEHAILNANYVATRLAPHFPILYQGKNGFVAHECLLDLRPLKESSGITEEDIAKRLMDFGFHAPTMSFPVAGTLMIEPTESESQHELDRFCDAMIKIKSEIDAVENNTFPRDDNPLVNAPHTLNDVLNTDWQHPYSREQATRPLPYLEQHKFWPPVNRIDNVYGDRNLICSCPSISEYE